MCETGHRLPDSHLRQTGANGKARPLERYASSFNRPKGANGGHTTQLLSAFVVQLDVPVEVVTPRFRRVPKADSNSNCGSLVGTLGNPNEMHAGLLRRPATLLPVAGNAAGNDVFPILSAALGDRHDMIEGQLRCRKYLPAVLAGVVVPRVDVGPGERHVINLPLDFDISQQANDRGDVEH